MTADLIRDLVNRTRRIETKLSRAPIPALTTEDEAAEAIAIEGLPGDGYFRAMLDRTVRIETKLTRLMRGETDQGVKVVHEMTKWPDHWKLNLMSPNVTLVQLALLLDEYALPSGTEVEVYERGRIMFSVLLK